MPDVTPRDRVVPHIQVEEATAMNADPLRSSIACGRMRTGPGIATISSGISSPRSRYRPSDTATKWRAFLSPRCQRHTTPRRIFLASNCPPVSVAC